MNNTLRINDIDTGKATDVCVSTWDGDNVKIQFGNSFSVVMSLRDAHKFKFLLDVQTKEAEFNLRLKSNNDR
jgi:hypothetical protein